MCRALAIVGGDDAFHEIGELLSKRGCKTVDDWEEWLKGEFMSLVRYSSIKLKKHRNAYLKALETMSGHALAVERQERYFRQSQEAIRRRHNSPLEEGRCILRF